MRIRRMACGSKESDPPFPFPPGASRGGAGPPTRRTLRASQNRWHASMQPLPPQEGFQTAPLKPPLRDPPEGLSRCTASRWPAGATIIARRKELGKAATSALTFMTFS